MNTAIVFSFCLLTRFSMVPQENIPMNSFAAARLFLDEAVRESSIPGVQYVVVDSNGTLFEYAGGWADIDRQLPMTSHTHLLAYSMTKTLTAAAILRLADQGRLHLDDKANDYLDVNPYGTSVTIRQLLAHTSGIPNPNPLRWVHLANARWDSVEEESALRHVLQDNAELDCKPGEKYAYSNINYWLLGRIVERVSGQSYREYMRSNVFVPLGCTDEDMGFVMPPAPYRSNGYLARWSLMNLVKGFFIDREVIGEYEQGGWLHRRGHYVNGAAFGGIVGTARGFAKFLRDQLRDTSILFCPRTKDLFFEQQNVASGDPIAMTPGWHIGAFDGRGFFFKEGGGGGFHCEMRMYPNARVATVIMTNESSGKVKGYLDVLDRLFFRD